MKQMVLLQTFSLIVDLFLKSSTYYQTVQYHPYMLCLQQVDWNIIHVSVIVFPALTH